IAADPAKAYDYTWKANSVAVVTDGTAVLGLGDIGPLGAMPVMEGKALLFKEFAGVDGFPICLDVTSPDEIVEPHCFEVEERLVEALDIPVFHDDQHGTAVVTVAALKNALKIVDKQL